MGGVNATSYIHGHEVIYKDGQWVYADTGELITKKRPCVRCGQPATTEGHDACLGQIPGVKHACCGHGKTEPYQITEVSG